MKFGTRIAAVFPLPPIASEEPSGQAREPRATGSRFLIGSAVADEVAR